MNRQILSNGKMQKTILVVAGQKNNDGQIYSEKDITKASQLHKNLITEETEKGLALIWIEDEINSK